MTTALVRLALLPFFFFVPLTPAAPAPANVRVTLATLHAAALTSPRAPDDSVDRPYFLVSLLGPHRKISTIHLPAAGHLSIHRDEAIGARPLVDLKLARGDSVRLLVSVLAASTVRKSDEARALAASTRALSKPYAKREAAVASALAPVTNEGARWLGSATLMLTNERGTVYWRALECVASCRVVSGGAAAAIPSPSKSPMAGVVELSGAGGTYHLQLQAQRAQ